MPNAVGNVPPPVQPLAPTVSPPLPSPRAAAPDIDSRVAGDLDKLTLSLRDYRTVMGENPTGTNAEITKALDGGNPKQAKLAPDGQATNGNGEMVDRWGTPYFFHQLSKNQMEIRSAGPDKVLWTNDDTVAN